MERSSIIYLYLSTKIHEKSIIKQIIQMINYLESKVYHIERYNNIKNAWLNSLTYNKWNMKEIYSYVHNGGIYRFEEDRIRYFYNYTGISCQVIDLLFEIITNCRRGFQALCSKSDNESITDKQIKQWRKEDDNLYGILAKKIMEKMKE